MTTQFTAPKGTFDRMPPRSDQFLAVRETVLTPVRRAGYAYVETPIFEDTSLYERGVGESTDVVTKEMYTFTDKGGRSLTLRPEPTAGLMRAFIEHRLHAGPLPVKVYTVGPNFRYERPQAGRFRHFTQADVEAIGSDDPALDAEIIALADEAFTELGLSHYRLLLTSLGDRACRPEYRELLQRFLRDVDLDDETRYRAEVNPLRVLDDKRPDLVERLAGAPAMVDHLCERCRAHYDAVRVHLGDLGVRWEEAPRLVRGLDYYTRTTFEFVHDGLGSQSAIGGGGRYDGLMADLGGPDLSGIGWGLGIDRTMLAMEAERVSVPVDPRVSVFVVPLGEGARRRVVPLAAELRRAGIATDLAYDGRGLKGAMKAADRSGAAYAVIVGDRDLADDSAQLKDLGTGEQNTVPLDELVTRLGQELSQKERTS